MSRRWGNGWRDTPRHVPAGRGAYRLRTAREAARVARRRANAAAMQRVYLAAVAARLRAAGGPA